MSQPWDPQSLPNRASEVGNPTVTEQSTKSASNADSKETHFASNNFEEDLTGLCDILNIPLTDVIDLTRHIDRGPLLDSGGFGQVHRGRWKNTEAQHQLPNVAMKVIFLPTTEDEHRQSRRKREIKRELEVWSKLRHRNILHLIGFAHIDDDPCMPAFISPLMQQGNVKAFLKQNPSSPVEAILYDIIKGLNYLHTLVPSIIHGDLKAANVLINDRGEACLCDFGLSRSAIWQTTATHVRGTLPWMAPELHEPAEQAELVPTQASDIYAYGMTCHEIISGEAPFSSFGNVWGLVMAVLKGRRPERIESCPDDIWTLITRCWAQNPLERLATDQAVSWMRRIVNEADKAIGRLEKFISSDALGDSSVQDPKCRCHSGTREDVLNTILNWLYTPKPTERIFWLHGPAGVGKTAIAQTICQSHKDNIAGSFFFSRSDPPRSDGNRLFPTLAWQLAKSIPNTWDHMACGLGEEPDLPKKIIEDQFEGLINRPCRAIATDSWPVVVVDGVDECSDESLQQRLLKIIGLGVTDSGFPLRFLVVSRPEAHIQETIEQYPQEALCIDLAMADEVYSDIERYLNDEFSHIASAQGLDPESWPGDRIIREFVSKSSGQFLYASTIIKFIGAEGNSATSQLDIVLGLKPRDGKSPFADLDALHMEILQRQPDQPFLRDVLTLLVINGHHARRLDGVRHDSALLLGFNWGELKQKLRKMHSVLKFEHEMAAYHRPFLDFLQDETRSCQYHINEHNGTKRYLQLIAKALAQNVSRVMHGSDVPGHECNHVIPCFTNSIRICERRIDLPFRDWEEALQPLSSLRDRWFQSGASRSHWDYRDCDKCSVFYYASWDMLLHLTFFQGASKSASKEGRYKGTTWISSSSPIQLWETVPPNLVSGEREDRNDVYSFSSLLDGLMAENAVVSAHSVVIQFGLQLDSRGTETAMKLQSVSHAQAAVNVLFDMINNKEISTYFGPHVVRNATQLAFKIYARIPLLPGSLFLDGTEVHKDDTLGQDNQCSGDYQGKPVYIWCPSGGISPMCQRAFVWGNLSHDNISSLMGIYDSESEFAFVLPRPENGTLRTWQQKARRSVSEVQALILDIARAIQYMHSLGVALDYNMDESNVFIDSNFHATILGYGLLSDYLTETRLEYVEDSYKESCSYEENVHAFGHLFNRIYRTCYASCEVLLVSEQRHEKILRLIQRCLSEDPEIRPTMEVVVTEMEDWKSDLI